MRPLSAPRRKIVQLFKKNLQAIDAMRVNEAHDQATVDDLSLHGKEIGFGRSMRVRDQSFVDSDGDAHDPSPMRTFSTIAWSSVGECEKGW